MKPESSAAIVATPGARTGIAMDDGDLVEALAGTHPENCS
jgi:hypothetical protein